jgi:2-oxoglutarate ferredoxin oxidoreductase subunit gamma
VRTEIRFAGVGGQGNILAGEWLALAAHTMRKHAIQAPTYTAQVRGGPTSVDVLIDDDEIIYPRLTAIDFFCCLAQEGWKVFSKQLKPDSIVVIDPNLVKNIGPGPQMIYRVPIVAICKETVGKMVYTSSVALGAYCALMPHVVPQEMMIRMIEQNAPGGTLENNLKAFRAGWDAVLKTQPESRDAISAGMAEEKARDTY